MLNKPYVSGWIVAALAVIVGCDSSTKTADSSNRDSKSPVSATPQPAAGDGVKDAAPAVTGNDSEAPATTPKPEVSLERQLQRIQRQASAEPEEALEKVRQLVEKHPENVQVLMTAMAASQAVGQSTAEDGDTANAYPLFKESGDYAERLLAVDSELAPRVASMMGTVFYNQACAFGLENDPANALKSLERAVECGFSNTELAKTDSDLASLRGNAEFDALLASIAERARKAMEAAIESQFAEFKPFDFDFADLTPVTGDANLSLSDYVGKVVVVDFWGTWCPPCRAEIPHFVELQETLGPDGLQIIGLNYERGGTPEEQQEKIQKFMEQNDMNYPCALGDDATRELVPQFRGYPTTLFIDRSGKVRLSVVGARPAEELKAVIMKLLADEAF